jgi:hypothetical protein
MPINYNDVRQANRLTSRQTDRDRQTDRQMVDHVSVIVHVDLELVHKSLYISSWPLCQKHV